MKDDEIVVLNLILLEYALGGVTTIALMRLSCSLNPYSIGICSRSVYNIPYIGNDGRS